MQFPEIRPIEILLVEDNPGDVRLTLEALKGAKMSNNLSTVGDGEAAMDFLYQRGEYEDAPRPDLILPQPRKTAARFSRRSRAIRHSSAFRW